MDSKLPAKPLEVLKKIDDIINNDMLLAHGSLSDSDSSTSAKLDLQVASVKAASASASTHVAVDHHNDGDDEVQLVQPPTTTKESDKVKKDIMEATMDDIEFIDEDLDEEPIQVLVGQTASGTTKIKSIKGHNIQQLTVPMLKDFCKINYILDVHGKPSPSDWTFLESFYIVG